MELTLKRLLEQAEFNQVKKGGYDRDEVNDLLDRAVAMATKVEAKLTQTMEAARNAGSGGPSPEEIEAEVERRVQARVAEHLASMPAPEPVSAPAGPSADDTAEEAARTLLLAQRTADAAVREAREDAARIIAEAEDDARRSRAELAQSIEDERTEAKNRIRAELDELEGARESLRSDVGILERHVEEQRVQLRNAIGELTRLLDDPAGFRLAPTPALVDAPVPEDDPAPLVEASREPSAPVAGTTGSPASTPPAAIDPPAPGAAPELSFGGVEHEPPAPSMGEPTQPVPSVADTPPDDPFMAELRKAIDDNEPLGPRDNPLPGPAFEEPDDRRGWRRGRR